MARVLLCGEVRGRVSELHRLLHQLQKKGPFDLAICTGSFFAAPEEPGGSPECSSFSPEENPPEGHPSPQDAPQKALGEAVCNALSDQFAVAFEELKGCSRSLPIPLYILDEAASRCVQRLQTQRPKEGHPPAAAPPSSTTERHHKVKTEDASADAATIDATPSEGLSADVKAEPNGDTSPGEEKSGADSDNPHQSCSVVSGTRDCTYTPLQLLDNVWVLAGAGVAELHGLNIAFYGGQGPPELACSMSNAPSHQQQQQEDPQQKEQNGADDRVATFALSLENGWGGFSAFRGSTDILLTTRPPLGMFDGLPPGVVPALATQQQKRQQQQQQDESPGANREKGGLVDGKVEASSTEFEGRYCRKSSCLADFLEPRHIVCSGIGLFWQRPHFRGRHFGYSMRLISLGVVGEKGPNVKAFHALQLRPITHMLKQVQQNEQHQLEGHLKTQGETKQEEPGCSAAAKDAAEEARAALFYVPLECNSPNPFVCASRQGLLPLHAPPTEEPSTTPMQLSPSPVAGFQGPQRPFKRPRETGVVLVENLPYAVTDEGPLKAAMEQFGAVKFVFMPKDKADPTRGTGKAFVVYVDPKCAAKATEASGQLEGGGRPLRFRLYYDKIPFDRPAGEKRVKCSDVIATEPHADCWFCLANPQVEKHMIVDIAERLYTAVPKGGLTSFHMLFIPIAHLPSLAYADSETRREAAELVAAARKAFHKQNLDLVVYERYVPMKTTKAMHCQLQAIPCDRYQSLRSGELFERLESPQRLECKGPVGNVEFIATRGQICNCQPSKKRARRAGLSLQKLPSSSDITALSELARDPDLGYFYLELPGVCTARGQTIERYIHVQSGRDSGKIPMNFGREVMAELLGETDKVNWQSCLVPKDQEARLAAELRQIVTAS